MKYSSFYHLSFVRCWCWLSVVSVSGSCLLLGVGCRLSRADSSLSVVAIGGLLVVPGCRLSGAWLLIACVGCRGLGCWLHGCRLWGAWLLIACVGSAVGCLVVDCMCRLSGAWLLIVCVDCLVLGCCLHVSVVGCLVANCMCRLSISFFLWSVRRSVCRRVKLVTGHIFPFPKILLRPLAHKERFVLWRFSSLFAHVCWSELWSLLSYISNYSNHACSHCKVYDKLGFRRIRYSLTVR